MAWVRHDIYMKLLRDDEQWMKLFEEQKSEAFRIAEEAAAAREQSLTSELTSARSHIERFTQDLADLADLMADHTRLQDDQDLQIRTTALTHAVHLASLGGTTHVPTEARAMENFLHGRASVESETALINSGWNSLIEMLLHDLQDTSSDLYQMVGSHNQANTARVIERLKR